MSRDITGLALGFAASGVLHLVKPEPYVAIVPKPLPFKKELVLGSGVLEIALGAMMLHPRTRRLGGRASVGLLAAVFPANVQMAMDVVRDEKAPTLFKAAAIGRLPLQLPMIRIAQKAARS
ncbi:putative membrane protein [Aeromicrobium panaciterrae]|uniref:Membrane protein n=1 Tax=Aeromicrobium panaciterrae TaxID=363861 RepID=A0ABU1UQG9_9ACTN|nr:hypothetical protein [Aeromicrobium panaciterrae]MDR7087388.1 putative membrane protein [Aeromicrobium panaciterrae]